MKITTVGIDLAKDIFRVHGCDARGRVVVTKPLTRHELRTLPIYSADVNVLPTGELVKAPSQ